MTRRLLLVRHSLPLKQPDVPAREWALSDQGVMRARELASSLDPGDARTVYSSVEPKALGTASAMADVWRLPVQTVAGLHEHDRTNVPLLTSAEFDERIRGLFATPSRIVLGTESADTARVRFSAAVMRLLLSTRGDLVVVTHGTVLALFVAAATGAEPLAFWRRLEMPCAVTLALPEMKRAAVTYVAGASRPPASAR